MRSMLSVSHARVCRCGRKCRVRRVRASSSKMSLERSALSGSDSSRRRVRTRRAYGAKRAQSATVSGRANL